MSHPCSVPRAASRQFAAKWALCSALLALAVMPVARAVRMAPPCNVPDDDAAWWALDQSFLSFAVEGRDFIDYSGDDAHRNEYSLNMLSLFSQKTGAPTYLRVGGTTQDNFHYDPSQDEAIRYEQPNGPTYLSLHANITVGKTWLQGFRQFSDVLFDLQVPLARKNLTNAIEFARDCLASFRSRDFNSFEIGNEPDIYNSSGPTSNTTDRPANYGPADYVVEWTEFADALEGNLSLPSGPNFQALTLSNLVGPTWTEETVFDAGLEPSLVKTISEHYYQSEDGRSLERTLMNHTATVTQMDGRFTNRIAYMKTNFPEIPFIIAEAASALGNGTGIRDFDLTASLGTALWTVDWLLYTATIGVDRVNMQLGSHFPFSPWLGSETIINNKTMPPQTLGSFYGNVFVADFIGRAGGLQITELPTDEETITAYGGYNWGVLTKLAFVNLEPWRESYGTDRPAVTVTLDDLHGYQEVHVQRLTGPEAGSQAEDITWGGYQWTAESNGLPVLVRDESEVVDVEDGAIEITLQASEAVLVSLIPSNYLGGPD